MADKKIIIDGVDVSEWTDEEVRYKFEKHSPKAIRQIAFDLYKQLARKEQECEEFKKQHEQYKPFYELGAKCTQLNEVADGLSNKCDKYKQALDEIEKNIKGYCKNMCMAETRETCESCQNTEILNIINKANNGE